MVKLKQIIIFFILVVILMLSTYFLGRWGQVTEQKKIKQPYNEHTDISLLNPEALSKNQKHFIVNFQPLRHEYDDVQKKYNQMTYVYFVYLNNSAWVGINEREQFVAASTVKVPLAMTLMKAVEQGVLSLDTKYTLEHLNLDEGFGELYKKEGATYTLRELMSYMLTQSDNTAANGIASALRRIGVEQPLQDVYQYMGWEGFEFGQEESYNKITVKLLTNMFLSLYNATYITPEHSQMILQDLTQSKFNDKIRAGVPSDVVVAHKVGISANNETFADCGIIYAPNRPYILCMASNGADEEAANSFMKETSEITYKYVINN